MQNKLENLLTPRIEGLIFLPIEAKHSDDRQRCLGQAETLFNRLTQHRPTTLPIPATGDQTGPKACQREEHPRRLIQGEMPEPCERPGKQRAPPPTAVMSGSRISTLSLGDEGCRTSCSVPNSAGTRICTPQVVLADDRTATLIERGERKIRCHTDEAPSACHQQRVSEALAPSEIGATRRFLVAAQIMGGSRGNPLEGQEMCNCHSEVTEKLKGRVSKQLPTGATGLDLEMQGYVFVFGAGVSHKAAHNVRIEYQAPKKAGGMKKVVQNMNMIATFCPFCGEKYEKDAG